MDSHIQSRNIAVIDNTKNRIPVFLWLTIFSITMAYIESAVVVYLRMIFYPAGFSFPIAPAETSTATIELGREAATILMLYAVAHLSQRKPLHRFCAFMFCFGVWDIFYYLWLYILLGWPPGLLTWDILFLIPVPWIGPVIAPVIVSISMIGAALIIVSLEKRGYVFYNRPWHWLTASLGGMVIILSFTIDFRVVIDGLMPGDFPWGIFWAGEAIGLFAFFAALVKTLKKS